MSKLNNIRYKYIFINQIIKINIFAYLFGFQFFEKVFILFKAKIFYNLLYFF